MAFVKNHLKLVTMLSIACLIGLVPLVFAQNPPPPQGQAGAGIQRERPRAEQRSRDERRPFMRMREPGAMRQQAFMRLMHDTELQKQLNVTPDQLKKLQDLVFNSEKSAIQDRATLQVRRLELQHLVQAETPDRAAIDKKLQEVSQAQGALERARINEMLDVRSVLTKEQQDKIRELMQPRMQTMRPGMNRQGMMRRGPMGRTYAPAPKQPGN